MNIYSHHNNQCPDNLRSGMVGFSLIEMMISIAIGLMLVAGMVGVLAGASSGGKSNDLTSELQSNGRFAIDHLKRELLHAGNRGFAAETDDSTAWVTPVITNECGTAGNFAKNISQAVWGNDDGNPFAANCLSSTNAKYNNTINSDVLVIRHAAAAPTTVASAVASTIYLSSFYSDTTVQQGANTNALYTNFALQTYVYYIGTDDTDTSLPALRRVSLVGTAMLDEMVVSGIEHMQVQYGRNLGSATAPLIQYFDATNIAGDSSATTATSWDDVSSVRIWLLARNAKIEPGYNNTQSYTMGDIDYAVDDHFRRQLFTGVVQLRNFSM